MRVAALPIRSGSDDVSEKRGVNRQRPDFGMQLDVNVTYYTGVARRDRPLEPGNRPLCNVHRPGCGDIDIGLCEVASTDHRAGRVNWDDAPLRPSRDGRGRSLSQAWHGVSAHRRQNAVR